MADDMTTTETTEGTTGTLADVVTEQGKPDAKPEAATEGGGAEGSNPAWTSQLPEEMRRDADFMAKVSKHRKIGDLAKAYAELEGAEVMPGKDADAETREAFYRKLGKPEKAEDYGLEDAQGFDRVAFAGNLTKEQAKVVLAGIKQLAEADADAEEARRKQMCADTDAALHKRYGDKYPEAIAHMKRGLNAYGGKRVGDLLQRAGLIYHPDIVALFIKLGEQTAEAVTTSRSAVGGADKYVPTSQGGTFNFKDL